MMPLADAAEFERDIAAPATVIIILLAFVASLLLPRWTALLALGVVLLAVVTRGFRRPVPMLDLREEAAFDEAPAGERAQG